MNVKAKLHTLGKFLTDPMTRLNILSHYKLLTWMSSETFLRKAFRYSMGRELDLENPVTYTEKLQWLKLYDHRPEYTRMVDKYGVKQYVAERLGEEHVIPLLGVWERAEDIDFDSLPQRFVLKTTHDSGGIVVCKDKSKLDIEAARKRMKRFLKRDYYEHKREWPYKDVKPRIMAEKYMEDTRQGELRDYKFFTFGGEPRVLYIAQGRGKGGETVADFFDMDFNHLPFTIDHDMADVPPEKPVQFEEMKRMAALLSQGTPQLRVDFYEVDGQIYFGEMTFFHCSGLNPFHPEEWDHIFGDWVTLPPRRG